MMRNMDLAEKLDFANHNATSNEKEIKDLCNKVLQYGFNAAFVNPCWVKKAREFLGSQGKVGTVVAFPLGQETTTIKIKASLAAVDDGADEIDVCANVGWLKEGREESYLQELNSIVKEAKKAKPDIIVKFIIEAFFLNPEEIKKSAQLVLKSGADFVKTTTGFGPRDAKLKYVEIIKSVVKDKIGIKAAGGISTKAQVLSYIKAGAARIGTSKAVEIIGEK